MTVRSAAGWLPFVLISGFACTVAGAQPAEPAPPSPAGAGDGGATQPVPDLVGEKPWVVRLDIRMWYTAPAGKLTLPSSGPAGTSVKLNALNIDDPRISPFGQIDVQADRWLFTVSGAHFSSDTATTHTTSFRLGDVVITPGDTTLTSLDFTFFQGAAGYRVWDHDFDAAKANRLDLWVIGGIRLQDLSFTVTEPGVNSTSSDKFFGEPFVGARMALQIARQFSAELEITGGGMIGNHGSLSLDVALLFAWRPIPNVGAEIGYRLLVTDTESGEGARRYRFDGSMAGLFAGVTIRF